MVLFISLTVAISTDMKTFESGSLLKQIDDEAVVS